MVGKLVGRGVTSRMAQMIGVSPNGIRHLEQAGIVSPARDGENGYRQFSIEDLSALYMYRLYRLAGLKLDDIKDALGLDPLGAICLLRDNAAALREELIEIERHVDEVARFIGAGLAAPSYTVEGPPTLRYADYASVMRAAAASPKLHGMSREELMNLFVVEHMPEAFFGILYRPTPIEGAAPAEARAPVGTQAPAGARAPADRPASAADSPVPPGSPGGPQGSDLEARFVPSRICVASDERAWEGTADGMWMPLDLGGEGPRACLHAVIACSSLEPDASYLQGPFAWMEERGLSFGGGAVVSRFLYLQRKDEGYEYRLELWVPLAESEEGAQV